MEIDAHSTAVEGDQNTPFGEKNRRRLIADYFAEMGMPTADSAWKRVYGLLLWVDRTTGLAHCYESDKCQPGRSWYARSLSFHYWLSKSFQTTPLELGKRLDWLFQKALEDYIKALAREHQGQKAKGERQRAVYAGQDFPLPGADPEVERIISEVLTPYFTETPPDKIFGVVAERLREYWKQENKRKNLLGEGFEDLLAAIVKEVCGANILARTRTSIAEVAGFRTLGAKDKATKVDLIVEHPQWSRPTLINVKWSIRADREDQLWDDFNEYVRFDGNQRGFDHYLITNEFDPARLNAVCDRREANNFIFKNVVHINTAGVLAAYGSTGQDTSKSKLAKDSSIERVRQQVKDGRLISLSKLLSTLGANR